MGLSGTLEAFPLSEVLRLLGRSGQTGRLIARSGEKEMRAYLQAGRLVVAWAGSDGALGDELIGRGLIDALDWEDVAAGSVACEQALQDGVSPIDFDHAVLDITIEGLAKMVDGRQGTFAFEEGETSQLRLQTELDLDAVLEGVNERLEAWRRLRSIVPDTSQPLAFDRVPAGSEVRLSERAWNLLVQMLPQAPLDDLIAASGRTSTAFIEDLLELLEQGYASIEGFTSPDEVDAALAHVAVDAASEASASIVPDDPLAGAGPTGWENELASIAAFDDEVDEEGDGGKIPLLEGDEAAFLADARESDGFDFGLVGIDVGPVKGRNLLEKDDSWQGILGVESEDGDPEPETEERLAEEPESEMEVELPIAEKPAPPEAPAHDPRRIDLGLDDDPHDDLWGSVLGRLDEVLADDEDDDDPANDPEHGYLNEDGDSSQDDGAFVVASVEDEADVLAAVAALEDVATEEPSEDGPADRHLDDDLPGSAEDLEVYEAQVPEEPSSFQEPVAEIPVPYDDPVAPEADDVDDAAATAEPEASHPADDPAPGMSNLLRRRARGALAKELRSLSD